MKKSELPNLKDLVFIGGGHSHALVLRMLGMNPIPGVRLTIISNVSHAPYSGMLPAHLAGIYDFDQTHIDLVKLAEFAGARFIQATACGLDLEQKYVRLQNRPPIEFDIACINIGISPSTESIEGSEQYSLRIKPVPEFLRGWNQISDAFECSPDKQVTIIGGGAGGVELAFAARARLGVRAKIRLIHSKAEILDTHTKRVREILHSQLEEKGIETVLKQRVTRVEEGAVLTEQQKRFPTDYSLILTSAAPAEWLKDTGLALTERGFIEVNDYLQSTSHEFIFSTGDIASNPEKPRPKSGVFAVRQANPLFENLRRILYSKPLKPYFPQQEFLGLIGTGDHRAVASRGNFAYYSRSMWWLKDWIDRRFMKRLDNLPFKQGSPAPFLSQRSSFGQELEKLTAKKKIRCRGCAAKLGGEELANALGSSFNLEDGSLHQNSDGSWTVKSIDSISSICTDPYLFARIAFQHAMNDLFAMGASPQSLLVSITLPFLSDELAARTLKQLQAGIAQESERINVTVEGGHTAIGEELTVTLAVEGKVTTGRSPFPKKLSSADCSIVLTRPIGSGVLLAGAMRLLTRGRYVEQAYTKMLQSHYCLLEGLHSLPIQAVTDVSGFGLAGHLAEMCGESLSSFKIARHLPLLRGVQELIDRGISSTLSDSNRRYTSSLCSGDLSFLPAATFSPETAGPLLIAVKSDSTQQLIEKLQALGFTEASVIASPQ
jgi:selenide,water dikinase